MQKADVIIIGAGPGGYETAADAASKGMHVILFEKDRLGGTCLNRGCIPTKCLCAAAEAIDVIKNASQFGIQCRDIVADYATARQRAESVMNELRDGIADLLKNVEVIVSEAVLLPDNKVEAGGIVYEAEKIIIATGSRPAKLQVDGADFALNSDDLLNLERMPERLTVIGGGVIGLEFASIANAFGTKVTVLEYCKEILPGCDSDMAKRLRSYLGRQGIDIVTEAKVLSVDSSFTVTFERKNKMSTVEGDMVLAAVGRRPVIPACKNGITLPLTEKGFIAVDEAYRIVGCENVYAIGDVNGKTMLAHAASAQGRIVLGEDMNVDVIPSVVFTHPECAFVSDRTLTASRSVRLPYSSNGKAVASGYSEGIVKLGYDEESRRIVSCCVIGSHAADIIAEASLAISTKMTLDDVRRSIHAHPTLSELLYAAVSLAEASGL